MIKPNELRIGNLVNLLSSPEPVSIPVGLVMKISEILKDGVTAYDHKEPYTLTIPYQRIDGIPVTEEILIKFGFRKSDSPYSDKPAYAFGKDASTYVWCEGAFYKPLSAANGAFAFVRITPAIYTPYQSNCKYVHQLQNFVFYFTGTEISIDLIFFNKQWYSIKEESVEKQSQH